jgi:hypothetical protein
VRSILRSSGIALVLLLAAASPVQARDRDCGDIHAEGVTPQDIESSYVRCRHARKLANKVSKVSYAPWYGCLDVSGSKTRFVRPCEKRGYSCRAREYGYSSFRVTCRKMGLRKRSVTWRL